MKKIGINIFAISAGLALGFYLMRRKTTALDDSLNQSISNIEKSYNPEGSFIEFFDQKNIKEAYDRYEKYIDLGLKKSDAFKAVVEDERNS